MSEAWHAIEGEAASGLLIVSDHASNHVPPDIDLGIAPALMREHIAWDIGVAPLAAALCEALGWAAILGSTSRLVLDCNREEESAGLIPEVSDGHPIPGNVGIDTPAREARIARFFRPYHAAVDARIAEHEPRLLVSLHSFTPRLATDPSERPWQIGVLHNRDERASRVALPLLREAGVVAGDNEPYSGQVLNATMNRHAEARGIPYLGLEVRQDLIGDAAGVARWCAVLAPVIAATRDAMVA